ncbi:MAG: hypothetical protein HOQ02_08435 [Lysobacter sp.]|nr:hypothetical protein [Lysobacter sp.]
MSALRMLAAAVLLACLAPAFAQTQTPPIEQQMTPAEFKAAGLDKLTPDELARLNAWLGRTISQQSDKAAAQATELVKQENRGFFHFGEDKSIDAHLVGEFRGFAKGQTYTLDNGQVWRQTDDAELAGVRLTNPDIDIKPAMLSNTWYMKVGKYNTRAQVKRIK